MSFDAYDAALLLIRQLRELLPLIQRHDTELAAQIHDAASSAHLNLAEGRRRIGKDRTNRYRITAGSADEVRAGLEQAEAWGCVARDRLLPLLETCDRLLAMTWRLTH